MPRSRNYQTKLVDSLKDPEEAAAYLSAALEEIDKELFLLALRNVADAQGGLSRLAEATGLNRENLYRMLSDKGNPEFYSLVTLLDALGFQLTVEPKQVVSKPATANPSEGKILSFRTRRVPIGPTIHRNALAADTKSTHSEKTVLISDDGSELGSLAYDWQKAELYVDLAAPFPDWPNIDVEIQTKDGNCVKGRARRDKGGKFILLQETPVKTDQVKEVVLKQSANTTKD
ncbi:MAG: addiction module antidote protein [Nitrospira sp.]